MTCREFHEMLPALALDALEPAERAACVRHLGETAPHAGCRRALDEARATASKLSGILEPERPDPRVWDAIEETIRARSPRHSPARWGD